MNSIKQFKGKAIYTPSGKAGEYSRWAVNFYNGCSARCTYCYNRRGRAAKILGADVPTLKKSLKDEDTALQIFIKEADKNKTELQKHGLFFNFVSDPCLHETWELNAMAIGFCLANQIPVKLLTKQTWWVKDFLSKHKSDEAMWDKSNVWRIASFGFTLTGHDELEPGAATNEDRIKAMKLLHDEGFKTWASIEPIIDVESSMRMIGEVCNHCDLMKIGLQSGGSIYKDEDLLSLFSFVKNLSYVFYQFKIYWKESFVKRIGYGRYPLGENEVDSDYNIFNETNTNNQ